MVRLCASLVCSFGLLWFCQLKIVSKIQTKPVRLGPIIVLHTHTGHDTVEDDTHPVSNLEFKVQGDYGYYFYERSVKEYKLNHPCLVHENYTHTDHNKRARHITFLLDCKATPVYGMTTSRCLSICLSASTIWLSCCVKVHCWNTNDNYSFNLYI